jgi:hypothetical protein
MHSLRIGVVFRRIAPVLCWTLLFVPGCLPQVVLKVSSQNCLHLNNDGSATGVAKREYLQKQNEDYDVTLLQEVMSTANLGDVEPGTHRILPSGLKGHSSYQEKYAVVYRTATVMPALPGTTLTDYPDAAHEFSRPPSGALLRLVNTPARLVWFVDYHAVFGNNSSVRKAEVAAAAKVYNYFRHTQGQTQHVVIGGDWNLSATDAAFTNLRNVAPGMDIKPNIPTSLKRNGAFSKNYDHFAGQDVWGVFRMENCFYVPLAGTTTPLQFRQFISDHRGIACDMRVW